MWSGVDPDVELFASGDVAEEDDEWAGGHSLDGGSNAATNAGASPARLVMRPSNLPQQHG